VAAPIALFAYRRARHLTRTIEALHANQECSDTELFVFSDAAKDEAASADVDEVRRFLGGISGFKAIELIYRDRNLGLAGNITSGVSAVLANHGSVIVVEDDIVVSPYFLRFMNDGLSFYRDAHQVGSISGYCYPITGVTNETYFICGADCWGWATWRDRWRVFNPNGSELLAQLRSRGLARAFDFEGSMRFTRMLEDQIAGRNDSWAVRWHASCFLRDLLVLYPGRSLAANIGHDGSGTHAKSVNKVFDVELSDRPLDVGGIDIEESALAREAIRRFFLSARATQPRLRRRLVAALDAIGIGDVLRHFRGHLMGLRSR
jgi:Glycosyl transferase family 2